MSSLHRKVVIVTGASRGIGAALARTLRTRGALLSLTARTAMEASADDLVLAGDLTVDDFRATLIERTVERFGRIDCLINNAGRGSYYSVSETPLDDARSLFELNFFAPLHLAQLATPWLKKTSGSLVNISSIAGQISLPWLPVYSASKFALTSITASQRMDLRRGGVNVMAVYPGYVDTEFQANAAGPPPPSQVVKGRRFAVSAAECAEAIVAGIEKRRRAVIAPRIGIPLVWLHRFLPALLEARLGSV